MYLAELRGKLSSRVERMEDILTSNVFSFFKYSTRDIFLKNYLNELEFKVLTKEAEEAEFKFWPHYEDGTEPDLVIIVGNYYLLIEAKYFSGFGKKTETTDDQLEREIKGGQLDAFSYGKEFYLIAITADYYYKKEKFEVIPQNFRPHFKWTNWQSVSSFLDNILSSNPNIKGPERDFSLDLYNLLDKKHLRSFQSITYNGPLLKDYNSIFFDAKTAKKAWKADAPELMQELKTILSDISDFSSANTETIVKEWITSKEIGFGKVMQPFRLSLVGAMKGPHLFDIAEMIGKPSTIERIKKAIHIL